MSDREGDKEKQPSDCTNTHNCPHMVETGGGFEGEQYRCPVCGKSVYLDYDEMR